MRERTALRWIVPIVALLLCGVLVLSIVTQGFTNWGTPQPQETLYTTNSDGSIIFLDEPTAIIENADLPEVIVEPHRMADYAVEEVDEQQAITPLSGLLLDDYIPIAPMSSNVGTPQTATSPLSYPTTLSTSYGYYINNQKLSNYSSTVQISLDENTGFSIKFSGNYCDWIVDDYDSVVGMDEHYSYLYYSLNGGSTWFKIASTNNMSPGGGTAIYDFSAYGSYQICFVLETKWDTTHSGGGTSYKRSSVYSVAFNTIQNVPLPVAPDREGYTFVGWYFDEALTQLCTSSTVTSDITLYAKYVINRHTVSFVTNGGSSINGITVDWSSSVTLSSYLPTKTGYNFEGWYTDSGLTTKASNSITVKSNVTLYAKWEIKILNVTLMVDGVLWKTLQFEYGTGISAVVSEIDGMSMNIENFATNGVIYDGVSESASLFADSIFTLSEQPLTETVKGIDWVQVGIYGGIGLVALGVIIALIVALKKKSYGR